MTEQNLPPQPPTEPQQPTPVVPGPRVSPSPLKDSLHSKRRWGMVVLLLFLLSGATLVPVGKIPLLRNLVYAFGFTPEEAAQMSFFQALVSWTDLTRKTEPEKPDPNAINVFGKAADAQRVADSQQEGKYSSLLNIKAVNAARARAGQPAEQVVSIVGSGRADSDHDSKTSVYIRNARAVANTDANSIKAGDVYFGQNANLVERDKRDGYNTVLALKKVKSPIAGVSSSNRTDWLMQQVDKATREDSQLDGIVDQLSSRGLTGSWKGVEKIGSGKPPRDLYWAWLTGRAARRTPQLVLKKTLASSGFDGAELPKSVFSVSGFSGVIVNQGDIVADLGGAKKYLAVDEKCRDTLNFFSSQSVDPINARVETIRSTIIQLQHSIPRNCAEFDAQMVKYETAKQVLQNECKALEGVYANLKQGCGSLVLANANSGTICQPPIFSSDITDFGAWCHGNCIEGEDCSSKTWDSWTQSTPDPVMSYDDFQRNVVGFYANVRSGDPVDAEHIHLQSNYFPTIDWGSSVWAGESITDTDF